MCFVSDATLLYYWTGSYVVPCLHKSNFICILLFQETLFEHVKLEILSIKFPFVVNSTNRATIGISWKYA